MPAPVDISDPFRGLSDPTRRQIVDLLAEGPLPVRLIAARFPAISRPAVSKHLRILREARLVSEKRSGRERYYRLESETVAEVLEWMAAVRKRLGSQAERTRGAVRALESPSRRSKRRRRRSPKSRPAAVPDQPDFAPDEASEDEAWKAW